jgi:hypothetical protein
MAPNHENEGGNTADYDYRRADDEGVPYCELHVVSFFLYRLACIPALCGDTVLQGHLEEE